MGELLRDAFIEIGSHKLRSLLTLSGIVFGAASLVAMTSLALGLQTMAYRDFDQMGFPNAFTISDQFPRSDATRAFDLQHPALWVSDAEALGKMPGVATALPRGFGWGCVVIGPNGRRNVPIDPVDAGYTEMQHFGLVAGRSLRALDIQNASRVAVIGDQLATDLFGAASAVGRTITIDRLRYTVVGVITPVQLELVPENFDWVTRRVYIPYTRLACLSQGPHRISEVLVTAASTADLGRVIHDGETLIRQRHRGVEDFNITNEAAEILRQRATADSVLGGWNIVMYTIAVVTLLVGGIGLFSVLLISVRERVREIGIRKALGADDGAILRLFLTESLLLSAIGAVIGVGAGVGLIIITREIAAQFGRNFAIPLYAPGAIVAVVFALVVGVLFGWYPARRAARLDPIVAIGG